jgi:hypothetical protein
MSEKKKAGRPSAFDEKMDVAICLRCSGEQKDAMEQFVTELNAKRKAQGIPGKIKLATWIRELALKHSGNEELGQAARIREKAIAAASIV